MNLKDRQKSESMPLEEKEQIWENPSMRKQLEQQIENSKNTIEKLKQLLQEALQALQTMTAERDDLLKTQAEDRKLVKEELEKQLTLNQNLENEKKILMEKEYLSRKDLEYVSKRLESEKKNGNWMSRRIRELEGEVARLKNRPLWKQIWDDLKPKPKWRSYNRKRKFYEFMEKLFHVILAVVFTIIVFIAVYWFMKWSMRQ